MAIITHSCDDPRIVAALKAGQLVVAPTDTIYGILASAADPLAVDRLYCARQRNRAKSCIILLDEVAAIPHLSSQQRRQYRQLMRQRPTTIAVPVDTQLLPHLVRTPEKTMSTLAFRVVPPSSPLAAIIRRVGPLLAPSANREGQPPATTIDEAISYFGDRVAVYIDGGPIAQAQPSRIISYTDDGELHLIRQ